MPGLKQVGPTAAVAYAPVGASSAFSASPLPVVSACFLRPAQ